jgi:host factor-I protein
MQRAPWNLQDAFLNQARKDNVPITIYLVNGYQLKGYVKAFDSFTVLIEQDGKQHLVYKHALSTLSPMRHVQLHPTSAEAVEEQEPEASSSTLAE